MSKYNNELYSDYFKVFSVCVCLCVNTVADEAVSVQRNSAYNYRIAYNQQDIKAKKVKTIIPASFENTPRRNQIDESVFRNWRLIITGGCSKYGMI